jgi:triacylglycerol lipase
MFVFVPGLGGFDRIRIPGASIAYFRRLEDELKRLGVAAFFPPQRPFATVAERAEFLARNLSRLAHDRIVFIAHSMGGLDCRYFIHHLDRDRRARVLATIGTPHRGTPLANWFLETRGPVQWLGRALIRTALAELTVESCERFNRSVPDREDVRYLSYAGVRPIEEVVRVFRPWARLINAKAGVNDSQVPLSSATWGTLNGVLRAGHFELAGWSFGARNESFERPFDHIAFFSRLVAEVSTDDQRSSAESAAAAEDRNCATARTEAIAAESAAIKHIEGGTSNDDRNS